MKRKKKPPLFNYAKYSGMALQMMVIIFLGVWGGYKLDEILNIGFPILTIILSLLSVALAIYIFIRDLLK